MAERHIVIAGNIGVGKSSFCALAAPILQAQPVFESVDNNPYLADFYEDMQRWAFPTQMYFFGQRVRQHQLIMRTSGDLIQDRSLYEDAEIFARNLHAQGTIQERDFQTYWHLYESMLSLLTPPDLVVYLRASLPCLQHRIAKRGRSYEQQIPAAYLNQLNILYDDWAARYALSPIVCIDTDGLDFVERPADLQSMLAML